MSFFSGLVAFFTTVFDSLFPLQRMIIRGIEKLLNNRIMMVGVVGRDMTRVPRLRFVRCTLPQAGRFGRTARDHAVISGGRVSQTIFWMSLSKYRGLTRRKSECSCKSNDRETGQENQDCRLCSPANDKL